MLSVPVLQLRHAQIGGLFVVPGERPGNDRLQVISAREIAVYPFALDRSKRSSDLGPRHEPPLDQLAAADRQFRGIPGLDRRGIFGSVG